MTKLNAGKVRINRRLNQIRQEIKLERISFGEIFELVRLRKFIHQNDVELLQYAEREWTDLETEEIEAFELLDYNLIRNVYTKETIEISKKIFDEELFEYRIEHRESFSDDLCRWIGESNKDSALMKQDLKLLMNMDDEYIFSSISTNEYICSTDPEFIQTCKDLIELNNSLK